MVEEQKSALLESCGHHCGVQMTGTHQYIGHCDCPECHNGNAHQASGHIPKPDPKEAISE